jgi:hypothetical protein
MSAPVRTDPAGPMVDDAVPMPDEEEDYVYVRFPDGWRAIRRSDVERREIDEEDRPRTARQRKPEPEPEPEEEFYVHLADGSVERVAESDLPGGAGTNAMHGHWERDSKVYLIIGVYPVETTAKN